MYLLVKPPGLGVECVCRVGLEKGGGEDRQDTQGVRGLKNVRRVRCRCTGTPTLGLPPVFAGLVAAFIALVYDVFAPMILQVVPW
jgi:hypothetical protein